MTTGYVLIAAIVILGGVIATLGDRIGTRVGKARLSVFKLRPRKTAALATVFTGSIIALSTLAILFAADERLRTGVFELERIQNDLRNQRQQLEATKTQKSQVERELAQARAEQRSQQIEAQARQAEAQKRLQATNQSLQAAIARQAQTQTQLNRTAARQVQTQNQLNRTQGQLSQITFQFQQAQARLKTVSQRARTLGAEIQQLQAERQQLLEQRNAVKAQIAQRDREIAARDQKIAQRDRDIAERDLVITQRQTRLDELETQQEYLEREVARLEQYYQDYQVLRQGNLALLRGQVLAYGVVRIVQPTAARAAVEQLLRKANQTAVEFTQPGTRWEREQVLQIPPNQVERIVSQIDDGRDYVVRILAAGNYVLGEKPVQISADATVNQLVFSTGDVLAVISVNPSSMAAEELQQRVQLLLGASRFRVRRAGVLGDTIRIGDNRIQTLIRFFEQLRQYNRPVEIQAVVADNTYTAGPVIVELVAVQNGRVVFDTRRLGGAARRLLEDALTPSSKSFKGL